MDKGDEDPGLKTQLRNLREDEKGDILFIFKPRLHIFRILGWVILAVIIIGYTVVFISALTTEPDFVMVLSGLMIFPVFLFVLYMSYISTFDNIIIYEYGLNPPLTSEGSINMLIMRRTYISFSAIEHFHLVDRPPSLPGEWIFSAHGRSWRILEKWDINALIPIIETGINFKFLVPPHFHVEGDI